MSKEIARIQTDPNGGYTTLTIEGRWCEVCCFDEYDNPQGGFSADIHVCRECVMGFALACAELVQERVET